MVFGEGILLVGQVLVVVEIFFVELVEGVVVGKFGIDCIVGWQYELVVVVFQYVVVVFFGEVVVQVLVGVGVVVLVIGDVELYQWCVGKFYV